MTTFLMGREEKVIDTDSWSVVNGRHRGQELGGHLLEVREKEVWEVRV